MRSRLLKLPVRDVGRGRNEMSDKRGATAWTGVGAGRGRRVGLWEWGGARAAGAWGAWAEGGRTLARRTRGLCGALLS